MCVHVSAESVCSTYLAIHRCAIRTDAGAKQNERDRHAKTHVSQCLTHTQAEGDDPLVESGAIGAKSALIAYLHRLALSARR